MAFDALPVAACAHRVCNTGGEALVRIDTPAIQAAAERLAGEGRVPEFDAHIHFVDGGPLTAQYLLVVDALNFCFWPDGELEYEHLAGGIKAALLEDPAALDAERLAAIDGEGVRRLLRWPRDLPQQGERARLLREVGGALMASFGGRAANLVSAASRSAVRLVTLLAAHMPGFRDQAVFNGEQVFFYKRAQIYAADMWGAFGGTGLGAFDDMHQLTTFPDYRVPVVLRTLGILHYHSALAAKVDGKHTLDPGSAEEVAIRAATVVAVEQLTHAVNTRVAEAGGAACAAGAAPWLAIHVDWMLWGLGERDRQRDPPHHRTLTIFY